MVNLKDMSLEELDILMEEITKKKVINNWKTYFSIRTI